MSGGTLGEIGNAIRDKKKHMPNETESEIIVVAGKNNIKQAQGSSELAKVAYSIDKGIEKIVNQIDDNQKVNFVNIIPEPEELTPHQSIISDYLELTLNKTSDKNDKVQVTHIESVNEE